MSDDPRRICPRPEIVAAGPTQPLAMPIYTSAVYRCADTGQASAIMGAELPGYVYARDGHPNADVLAEKCRLLHAADRAVVCSSGMAALAAAALALLQTGDRVVASNMLYGRTQTLLTSELGRLGIACDLVDTCDLDAAERALARGPAKLLVVETISNPLLRVADIKALAERARAHSALLLVDNTFAGPVLCRPLALGADLVVESLTKTMSGHSDVVLGALCGRESSWSRIGPTVSTWGLASSPFDCWLAMRGLGTLPLRIGQASTNALDAAEYLQTVEQVAEVHYPGLENHPDHVLAQRQLTGGFGTIVTFRLREGLEAADEFIRAANEIPFCPSLGDLCTTLSHPASTSHRSLTCEQMAALGIDGGTIRLSLGIEPPAAIRAALATGFAGLTTKA
ncbi:MAG TPA: PLP-dependent aspartate aminotransferase family protein [Pirellulales bacterium]|jgi:cystathionine beta-lyase/cystathionine gamma-synthase|nr:PLP-dependent aspartate aminotransferase family protein [Pirellulales bacterium]